MAEPSRRRDGPATDGSATARLVRSIHHRIVLLVLLVLTPSARPGEAEATAARTHLSAAEDARLERGETVARLTPGGDSGPSEGLAARVLPTDLDRVWRAVVDLDHWHEWVPFLETSARQEDAGASPTWELRFDLPAPLRDRYYRVAPRFGSGHGGGRTVSWRSIPGSGNVAWARVSFLLELRGPGKTLVVFRSATDTGDRTPRFLLDRALRESLPWVIEGLAQQVNRCRYTEPWPDGCREAPPWTP